MTWSIDEWNSKAFMQWPGLRVRDAAEGRATLELQVLDHHRGGGGTLAVNGAILAYMHDVVQGVAIGTLLASDVRRMATLNLSIEYPKLLLCGPTARVQARVLRLGRTVAFCESEFRDDGGELCSRCSGTYQVKRSRAAEPYGEAPLQHPGRSE
jgi:uncharacterized protein (TIGR00369 family)